ncbi:hypothetical protein [Paenibacillus polymyxa]
MANLPSAATKLVMVEGIPGSGKSTLSQYIQDTLNTQLTTSR